MPHQLGIWKHTDSEETETNATSEDEEVVELIQATPTDTKKLNTMKQIADAAEEVAATLRPPFTWLRILPPSLTTRLRAL